ncbi:hypothetical protein D1BOALGB6SA_98, partial [Olavius sp. associated proteobacterium Delta 1]
SIKYQASSICPEKATISDITAWLDDKNLCNVRVYCDVNRHSCEGRNPENPVLLRLDARLRGHDEQNTLTTQLTFNQSSSQLTWGMPHE